MAPRLALPLLLLSAALTGPLASARRLTVDETIALYGFTPLPAEAPPLRWKAASAAASRYTTLRAAGAARGVLMGAESALYYFSDPLFQPTLYAQYALTEPENECKPDWISPVRGEYDTSNCSYTISQMRERGGGQARACCVVWGAMAQPPWLAHGAWNASSLAPVMAELMDGIMGADGIKGNVLAWDVVNEPLCDQGHCPADNSSVFKPNTWWPTLGEGRTAVAHSGAERAELRRTLSHTNPTRYTHGACGSPDAGGTEPAIDPT